MTDIKKLYLQMIKDNGRILNDDEAFDFYTDKVMRSRPSCKFNPYRTEFLRKRGIEKHVFEDYSIEELKSKANLWHKRIIGSFVISGFLKLDFESDESITKTRTQNAAPINSALQ